MVDTQQRRWTGVIKSGKLSGYSVEVRQQHLPWRLYILAFTSPDESSEPEITFARGRTKLAEHFRALSISVTWSDGRGPLAPERAHLKLPRLGTLAAPQEERSPRGQGLRRSA